MVTSNDLKGTMAMMPAFTTKDGDRIDATDTVDTDELTRAVDKLIRDGGVNVLTTTGSFGEFHTLLRDEHKKLIEATVAAAKKRVPLFIGCTNLNPREAIRLNWVGPAQRIDLAINDRRSGAGTMISGAYLNAKSTL